MNRHRSGFSHHPLFLFPECPPHTPTFTYSDRSLTHENSPLDDAPQGGGFQQAADGALIEPSDALTPVKNEARKGLSNGYGTIAMARTDDPNSATDQFFINLVDNRFLDPTDDVAPTSVEPREGYTAFGQVVEGMKVRLNGTGVSWSACALRF